MKKILLSVLLLASINLATQAQAIPSFAFGLKGGLNLSKFSTNNTLSSDNQAGYLAGVWARVGALGFNFQPELYYSSKIATVTSGGETNTVKLNSIDVPLLFGMKVGTLGIGGRFYTGPVASFIINKDQSFGNAVGNVAKLNFKDQNHAWQFGAGADFTKFSVDLRYELGLTNLNGYDQKLNLFTLTAAYTIF
ncbi:porin family protein [Mucilaginibacter paludis]|nr:porin family protein [Mucilaginibacter paludis]